MAAAVGLICCLAALVELTVSLPSTVLLSQRETSRILTLDVALVESNRALTQTMVAAASEASRPDEGPFPIRKSWSQLTATMNASCAGTYGSRALTDRMTRLCEAFAAVGSQISLEFSQFDPPDQPLDPVIVRSLALLSSDISETAALAVRLTTAVFERTAARYNLSIIVLALSTTGFLASGFILIFLLGRGSILHFEQWQKAVRAAERTSEARDRLQETIEALPAGVVLYDADDRLVLFNSMAASAIPSLRIGAIGMTFRDIATEDGRARKAAGIDLESEWVNDQVARFASKGNRGVRQLPDGRWLELYEKSTPAGRTVGLRVDITHIKAHELEIARAHAEYLSLVDSLADVVFAVDVHGRLTVISAAAAVLFGKTPAQLIGTRLVEHVDPADRGHMLAAGRDLVGASGDAVSETHFRLILPGGKYRHVEARFRKTLGGDLKHAVISGVIRDVEERVQLTRELADDAARLHSIVESSGALIVMADHELRIVMVNSGFKAMVGVRDADCVGRVLTKVIDCAIDPAVLASWLDGPLARGCDKPVQFTTSLRDAVGRQRLISMTATPVTDERRIVRNIVLLGVDDTARRDTELQLFDAERMNGLGEMAATLAHELNQPLQVMGIAAEVAIEEIDEAAAKQIAIDGKFVQEKLKRILAQVGRAARLIKETRAYARRTLTEEAAPFELGAAVRGALDLTQYLVQQSGATVAVAIADDLPPIFGHISRMEQVLINLINNARDALGEMPKTGRKKLIIVSAQPASCGGRKYLRLAVRDNGPGIADHVLKRLFEPFLTTKPRGKGTGLGLSLCKRIVEQLEGTITACNLPEGGAHFEIMVPALDHDVVRAA